MSRREVFHRPGLRRAVRSLLLTVALCLVLTAPIAAIDFGDGMLTGSIDTTISYGAAWRMADRDLGIIGLTNGGTAFSVNSDDGNLNYDKGLVSSTFKVTSELDIRYGDNVGGFFRFRAFYDYENEKGTRARTPLSEWALNRVGHRADLLDAYVWFRFHLGDMPAELRVGEQVVSWGESTFIQNSINAINPVDVSAIRVPGAELREALLPEGMVFLSISPTIDLSLEALYIYDWADTEIDPPGSYFSTNDFAGDGGNRVMLGFGSAPDWLPWGVVPAVAPVGAVVPRAANVEPDDSGQYGLALRWFVPALNNTEFGFYYLNYHSRLPTSNAMTGSITALLSGNYAGSMRYFLEFPDDIKLFGVSYNTMLGTTGVALQGEVSYRVDAPLQIDDVELLYASLSPLALVGSPVGQLLAATNQVGAFGFGEQIQGYIRRDVWQAQTTATKAFGPMCGADQGVLLWEGAYTKVSGMPDQTVLRLEGPGTFVSGNAIHQGAGVQPGTEPLEAFASDSSWGYRLAGRLDYNNAIGPINVSPRFSWQHDVSGVSPGPGGNFIEGRKALTLGVRGTYLSTWELDLSYTVYSGAGRYNLINDRDFLAANVKYSF